MQYISLVISIFFATVFITVVTLGKRARLQTVLKGIASIAFICVAIVFYTLNRQIGVLNFSLLLTGLILGALGDVLLALKDVFKTQKNIYFLLGLTSFLAGHIFYIILFSFLAPFSLFMILFAVILFILLMVIAKLLKCSFGSMYAPVCVYCLTISIMLFSVVNRVIAGADGFSIAMLVAAILFFLSDIVLCFIYFNDKTPKFFVTVNLTLYYSAQNLLALAPLFFALGLVAV